MSGQHRLYRPCWRKRHCRLDGVPIVHRCLVSADSANYDRKWPDCLCSQTGSLNSPSTPRTSPRAHSFVLLIFSVKKFDSNLYTDLGTDTKSQMPMHRHRVHHRRRRMRGRGFMDFGKANNFLKTSKLVSTVGNALGAAGVPYASKIGSFAGAAGYGRRRGRGLKLAGMGIGLSGRRHRRR